MGDDSTWTIGGFPNEVEVSMSVQDLYPTMTASSSVGNMKYNIGLCSFLECMAGLSFNQLNAIDRIGLSMEMGGNEWRETLSFSGLRNWGKDMWSDRNTSLSRIW